MRKIDRTNKFIFSVILLCLFIIAITIFSEKSDLFNGIGSDGLSISHFSPDLLNHLKNKTYLSDAGTRILPMLIAHVFYKIVSFFKSDKISIIMFDEFKLNLHENIVLSFEISNLIILCLTVIIFTYILYKRNFSFRFLAISICLFCFNFMFLKQFFFEPVFFDPIYLFYSILLLFSLQFKKKWLQYLLLYLSIFTSSLTFIFSILLILTEDKNAFSIKIKREFVLIVFILFYLGVSYYLTTINICTEFVENKTISSVLYVSIITTVLFLISIICLYIPKEFIVRFTKNYILYLIVILSVLSFLYIKNHYTLITVLDICDNLKDTIGNKIINNIRQVNSRPLGFLSSHFNYFGLIIIYILVFGKSIKNYLKNNERYIPLVLFFIFSILTSESRYLTTFIPLILIFLFEGIDLKEGNNKKLFSKLSIILMIIINIIWSGFYIKINPLDTTLYYNLISSNNNLDKIFINPLQKYFKHLGPWTSNESYLWQLSVFIITLIFFIVYCKYDTFYSKKSEINNH